MAHLDAGVPNELLLRVTPPRVPRDFIARAHLSAAQPTLSAGAVVVQAPAGFGKTFLLAQWRREFLALGAVVAWVSAQPDDDERRFLQCLAMAVRLAAARPTFGHTLLAGEPQSGLDGITTWLAEVAQSALNVVLMVDDVDRLPAPARELLAYLLRNAPPNLRTVVGARSDSQLDIEDLVAYGDCVVVGAAALRFELAETLALVQSRLQGRLDPDTAARLHEVTEGWPLGLQLALAVLARSGDPRADVVTMASGASALHVDLMDQMLANLDPADVDFLSRVSIVEHLYPDLCRAMTDDPAAAERLARMCRDTPVLVAGEDGGWLRLHTLARETLRRRVSELPQAEQAALHERASAWLAAHDQLELAALHALRAGRTDQAYDLAERSLYESLMTQGHQTQVQEWLDRIPTEELERRPRLVLAAAWSLALSERHEEAERWVDRLLAGPAVSDALRCECALILGGAAVYADDPDRFAQQHDPWIEHPPLGHPLLLHVHANRTAYRTLLDGNPALARMRQQQAPRAQTDGVLTYLDQWAELVIGLTYLWEGQVKLVEGLLRPVLARAEIDLGRRSPFASMLAAFVAAAVWEQDRPQEVAALLANRLDVLERRALPEAVLLAYRTLARAATAQGQEHRAIELLDAMYALGVARKLPRLCIASLTDQIRMHARRHRAETCQALLAQIQPLIDSERPRRGPLWLRNVEALQDLAHGYTCVAARQWRDAIDPLTRANAFARSLRMGRLTIEILGLRAFVLDQCGERSQELLHEAVDLAQAYGLTRVFADAHPDLGRWVQRMQAVGQAAPAAVPAMSEPPRTAATAKAPASMALTPKEREVLQLLARNLSNKEIGLAMQVGEETIKWHMKNLFAKLDAGNRKQLVARSRLFGLID